MIFANVKYFYDVPRLEAFEKGDWIDARACAVKINGVPVEWYKDEVSYAAGAFLMIDLGFSMQCPDHYEAHVVPRSSTFKNYGLIQTNHCGIIDWSYRGDNDKWFAPMFALRTGKINKYDRIVQFRFIEKMPVLVFKECDTFNHVDRGGFGSTGVK